MQWQMFLCPRVTFSHKNRQLLPLFGPLSFVSSLVLEGRLLHLHPVDYSDTLAGWLHSREIFQENRTSTSACLPLLSIWGIYSIQIVYINWRKKIFQENEASIAGRRRCSCPSLIPRAIDQAITFLNCAMAFKQKFHRVTPFHHAQIKKFFCNTFTLKITRHKKT